MPEHIFQLLLINYDTIYRVFHTFYRFYYSDEILFFFFVFLQCRLPVYYVIKFKFTMGLFLWCHTHTHLQWEEINQFYVANILSKTCGYNRPTLSESCGYNRAKQNIKMLKFIAKQLVDKNLWVRAAFSRYKQLVVFLFLPALKLSYTDCAFVLFYATSNIIRL